MDKREKDWTNILFLSLTPPLALFGTLAYAWRYGVAWWEPVLCLALFALVGVGIGSGYHRYFSHRTYEAHPLVEAFLLVVGAMALQNSALQWSRDHRDHHRFTDTDGDPYSVTRGFFWAHMGWVFYKEPAGKGFANVPDLLKNRLVMWQHRWYI